MNILLLSVGTRNKIVQYFKQSIDGIVVATDMQAYAPAIYEADRYYIVPEITNEKYLDTIIKICIDEKIDAVLSLIDPELSLLAKNQSRFKELGVTVVGSSFELCEMALDKMKMYRWLVDRQYNCARSYKNLNEFDRDYSNAKIQFPVLTKPIKGSASIAVDIVNDRETLEMLFQNKDLMVQEYLAGQEIGVDCYIDMISGELVSIFAKKKLRMRAGETDKSISMKDQRLFDLIESFVTECGWRGPIDIDMYDVNGTYYISEVNPRFGGGYPHAHECGCNHMKMIENNINGIINEKKIGEYPEDVIMMKYSEVSIISGNR